MRPEREQVERLLADVRRRREEAEAEARNAAESLIREASGLKELAEVDPRVVRGAADDYAAAVERLRELDQFARELRGLLY